MVKQHFVVIFKSNFPHFYWCKKWRDRPEAHKKGLRQMKGSKVNGCNNKRMHHALLSKKGNEWLMHSIILSGKSADVP